jgi:hypothetical protein
LLRVHELGSGYGPPTDFIDVEVVAQFVGDTADAYGFQLRTDSNQPVWQGMLDLLRDAFNNNWIANIDYDTPPGSTTASLSGYGSRNPRTYRRSRSRAEAGATG